MLSSMKTWTSFEIKFEIDFIAQLPYFIQDTIHIGTKLRNRLLNSPIVLYIGTHIVSIVHIKILLKMVSKEVHGLVLSDVVPEDRQNYGSLEKIMHDRVINAMKTHVADCEATVMYLTLCKLITSAFTVPNLTPIKRIYNIWYALYFVRLWRKWLKSTKGYSLSENFISDNAYTCLEINAHNLVKLIQNLRSKGQEHLFLPQLR